MQRSIPPSFLWKGIMEAENAVAASKLPFRKLVGHGHHGKGGMNQLCDALLPNLLLKFHVVRSA